MTGTSDDEEGKWKNRSTTLRRLGRQYSPDVTPEVASRRLKQWIVGNPVLLGLLHENGWTASRRVLTPSGTDCAGPWRTLMLLLDQAKSNKTEYET